MIYSDGLCANNAYQVNLALSIPIIWTFKPCRKAFYVNMIYLKKAVV